MDARPRGLDLFKAIVLFILILMLFLFNRHYKGAPLVSSGILEQTQAQTVTLPPAFTQTSPASAASVPEQIPASTSDSNATVANVPACQAAPARISRVGVRVQVTNALIPLRAKPAIPSSYIGSLTIGTQLDVIGVPVCVPYLSGANLWWQVRRVDGKTGWAAEASATKPVFYYLQEIK